MKAESTDWNGDTCATMKSKTIRNIYTLEVYELVNELVQFAPKALMALRDYYDAKNEQQAITTLKRIKQLPEEFISFD